MSYTRRLWLIIVRRARHSLYLFLLVFLFALLGIVSCFFQNIVANYEVSVIYDIGYSLMLYRADGEEISQEVLDEISQINGFVGYNQEYDMLITPVNFRNVIANDASNVFAIPNSDLIRLYANTNTMLNPTFSNNMELIDGKMPSNKNGGAIIDEVLALENKLSVGDTILIQNPHANQQIEIAVIGIYKTTTLPQETWMLPSGNAAYGQSPYSYVFCDIPTYERVLGYSLPLSSAILYAEDMKSLDKVSTAITDLELTRNTYQCANLTKDKLESGTSAARAVNSAATILTSLSVCIAAAVLFMVVLLWVRACYKDISILISLGESRYAIVMQYFILTTIIASLALVLSLPLCYFIINHFSDSFISYMFAATGNLSGLETDKYIVFALGQNLQISDYIKSNFMLLIVVWVSTLFSSIEIFRCKPVKLFHST